MDPAASRDVARYEPAKTAGRNSRVSFASSPPITAATMPPASTQEMARGRKLSLDASAAANRRNCQLALWIPRSIPPAQNSTKSPVFSASMETSPPATPNTCPNENPMRRPTFAIRCASGKVATMVATI